MTTWHTCINTAWITFDMVSLARFTPRPSWLLVLYAIALGLSLAAPVLVETWKADLSRRSDGSLDPVASQSGDEDHFTVFHIEAFDLMDDSVLLITADRMCWRPVAFAFNISLPVEWAWFPAPPVRPPISSNSI
jgi:hypothetical protein